jgi:DNA-binding winged helix-turn-helix (wHTH) protein
MQFVFLPFELDPGRRRLTASGEPVAISDRHLDVLLLLVARAGQVVPKDDLIEAGWKDIAVGDNSLEQAISSLRRLLGPGHIDTVARRGYRFSAPVTRAAARETDAGLEALLAPHRAFLEGRAALETLDVDQVARARRVFEDALHVASDQAAAHIGLANACAMQFEITRADSVPDADALAVAMQHAREACRLESRSGEAWATLGFVLSRRGPGVDALAAAKRAVTLEPDDWRHHFRLAFVGWGDERLRAAHRTLALLPGFPLAHWLAATVYVARQVPHEAERELDAGIASQAVQTADTRFSSVALHWLMGLVHLASGDEARALEAFERELVSEDSGHLYARECAANTWYAIGALHLRRQHPRDAAAAFERALARVPTHPMAQVGLAAAVSRPSSVAAATAGPSRDHSHDLRSFEITMARAAGLVLRDAHDEAARLIDGALAEVPPGNAGWLLPVEPLLNVSSHPDVWSRPLARVRNRAA